MERRDSFNIFIFDWENDKIVLEYDKKIEGWKLQHENCTEVCICGMNQLELKHYMCVCVCVCVKMSSTVILKNLSS